MATVSSFVKVSKNGILLIGQSDRSASDDIPESNPVGALRIPVGLQSRLLDIPAEEITNQTVDITGQFADMVKNREDIRSVATAVKRWISGRDKISFQDKLILDILSNPEKYLGSSVKKVTEDSGHSSRHLRRLFLLYSGFSTKDYFEVFRDYFLKMMSEGKKTQVTKFIKASREKVYRALLDGSAVAVWHHPTGMTCRVQFFEPWEGGRFRISLSYLDRNSADEGKTEKGADTFSGVFAALVPNRKEIEMIRFETNDAELQGEMRVTITLVERDEGTEITWLHENVPGSVNSEDNELGTRMTLDNLAAFVEAPSAL